ncbi:hypothetical protein JCM9279_003235 [Rhodotorula babjevae]
MAAALLPGSAPLTKLVDPSNNFEGEILIDHKPVQIYKVEHAERKTTCFIEAVEGKEYQVRFLEPGLRDDFKARLYVDGTFARAYNLTGCDRPPTLCVGARVSPEHIRPFMFAKIALTDDPDEATTSENVIKALGTVRITFHRIIVTGEKRCKENRGTEHQQPVVDERSKKASTSHSTAYGDKLVRPSKTGRRTQCIAIDPSTRPSYTLEFKYRSRDLLELDGIVEPRPASPSPARPSPPLQPAVASNSTSPAVGAPSASSSSSGKKRRSSSTDSGSTSRDQELQEMRAKIARLEEENSQYRAGASTSASTSGGAVKREAGGDEDVKPAFVKGEPIGTTKMENGRMVIDLLDDDDD